MRESMKSYLLKQEILTKEQAEIPIIKNMLNDLAMCNLTAISDFISAWAGRTAGHKIITEMYTRNADLFLVYDDFIIECTKRIVKQEVGVTLKVFTIYYKGQKYRHDGINGICSPVGGKEFVEGISNLIPLSTLNENETLWDMIRKIYNHNGSLPKYALSYFYEYQFVNVLQPAMDKTGKRELFLRHPDNYSRILNIFYLDPSLLSEFIKSQNVRIEKIVKEFELALRKFKEEKETFYREASIVNRFIKENEKYDSDVIEEDGKIKIISADEKEEYTKKQRKKEIEDLNTQFNKPTINPEE